MTGDVNILSEDPRWYDFLPRTSPLNFFSPGWKKSALRFGFHFYMIMCAMSDFYSDVTTKIQNHENLTGFGPFFVKMAEFLAARSV